MSMSFTITQQLRNNTSKEPEPLAAGAGPELQWAGWPKKTKNLSLQMLEKYWPEFDLEDRVCIMTQISNLLNNAGIRMAWNLEDYNSLTYLWKNDHNIEEVNLVNTAAQTLALTHTKHTKTELTKQTVSTDSRKKPDHCKGITGWWHTPKELRGVASPESLDRIKNTMALRKALLTFCTSEEAATLLPHETLDEDRVLQLLEWIRTFKPRNLNEFVDMFERNPPVEKEVKKATSMETEGIPDAGPIGSANDEFCSRLVGRLARCERPNWIESMAAGRLYRLEEVRSKTELICPPNIGKTELKKAGLPVSDRENDNDDEKFILQGLIPCKGYTKVGGGSLYIYSETVSGHEQRHANAAWSNAMGIHIPHIKISDRDQLRIIVGQPVLEDGLEENLDPSHVKGAKLASFVDSDGWHASKNATLFEPEKFKLLIDNEVGLPYGAGKGAVKAMLPTIDDYSHGRAGPGRIVSNTTGTKISTSCWPDIRDHTDQAHLRQGWQWRIRGELGSKHDSRTSIRFFNPIDVAVVLARINRITLRIHMNGKACGCAELMAEGQEKVNWTNERCPRCKETTGNGHVGVDARREPELQGGMKIKTLATWVMVGIDFKLEHFDEQAWFGYNREPIPWAMAKEINSLPKQYASKLTPCAHPIKLIVVPDNGGKTLLTKSNPCIISMWHTFTAFGISAKRTFAMNRPATVLNAMLPDHVIAAAVGDLLDTNFAEVVCVTGFIHAPATTFHAVDVRGQLEHLAKQKLTGSFNASLPAMLINAAEKADRQPNDMWRFHDCKCGQGEYIPTAHLFAVGNNCKCVPSTSMLPGTNHDSGRIQERINITTVMPIALSKKGLASLAAVPEWPEYTGGNINDWGRHCPQGLLGMVENDEVVDWTHHQLAVHILDNLGWKHSNPSRTIGTEWVTDPNEKIRKGANYLRKGKYKNDNVHGMHSSVRMCMVTDRSIMMEYLILSTIKALPLKNHESVYVTGQYDIQWENAGLLVDLHPNPLHTFEIERVNKWRCKMLIPGITYRREIACWRLVIASAIKQHWPGLRVIITNGRNEDEKNIYLKLEDKYADRMNVARQHEGFITLNPWDDNTHGFWWCEMNFKPSTEILRKYISTTLIYGHVYGTDELMEVATGTNLIRVEAPFTNEMNVPERFKGVLRTWRPEGTMKMMAKYHSKEIIIR
nr:polyprotein [Alphaendornavirus sp.]